MGEVPVAARGNRTVKKKQVRDDKWASTSGEKQWKKKRLARLARGFEQKFVENEINNN